MMDSPPSVGFVEEDDFDLRSDLIESLNSAKTAKDPTEILQFLTEAREIVLHRDENHELLKAFASEFAEFHAAKKATVRFFVIKFVEDACKECKDVIPTLFRSLTFLVRDKNSKNLTKVWVTAMNLFRPALALLCEPEFYENNADEARNLADDIEAIRFAATAVFKDKKNKVMPIIDMIKTIALSYLLPDPQATEIDRSEMSRGPKEARTDTGPDSFTLAMIPRDHPVLSIVALEQAGTDLVVLMCDHLLAIANEGNDIKPDSARKCVPLLNAVQILVLYRPSVRDQAVNALISSAVAMKVDEGENAEEPSQFKLRFVQNLRTNFLELLKEKWRVLLKDWRQPIADGLRSVGARDQADKALAQLDSRDQKLQRRQEREQERRARERQHQEELEAAQRLRTQTFVQAVDAEELRKKDYPRMRNTLPWEEIQRRHEQPAWVVAEMVIRFMDFLPGPPPQSSIVRKPEDAIQTYAKFVSYIERETASSDLSGDQSEAAAQAAARFKVSETIEPRHDALERMLEQHQEHVPASSLAVFTSPEGDLPSRGDLMIARAACDFVRRKTDSASNIDLRPVLVRFIADDLPTRFGLAQATLFHLFAYATKSVQAGSAAGSGDAKDPYDQYDDMFLLLVEALLEKVVEKEKAGLGGAAQSLFRHRSLARLFTGAPRLPMSALPVLVHFCENKGQHQIGLAALRDLVAARPVVRKWCLDALVYFAVSDKTWAREDAVRCVANQVYVSLDGKGREITESFALGMLQAAVSGTTEESPEVAVGKMLEESKAALVAARRGGVLEQLVNVSSSKDSAPSSQSGDGESTALEEPSSSADTSSDVKSGEGAGRVSASREGSVKADSREGGDDAEMDERDDEEGDKDDLGDDGAGGAVAEGDHQVVDGALEYEEEEGFVKAEEKQGSEKSLENSIMRRIELYVALCRRHPGLLKGFMEAYASTEKAEVRQILENAVVMLVQILGKQLGPAQALVLFQSFPSGAAPLLIHALNLLVNERICDSREKRLELVAQAKAIEDSNGEYLLFESDDRFVIPILGSLSRTEIRRYLMGILTMDKEWVQQAVNSILVGARFAHQQSEEEEEEEELENQPLQPADLLVTLVNMPLSEEVTLQTLINTTEICFARRDVYTRDVLMQAINELLVQSELPRLLLRVMIRSVDYQPQIKQFVAKALELLAEKQVWQMGDEFWQGFIVCAYKVSTPAYPILLQLPLPQLQEVFNFNKAAAAKLVYYARQNAQALNLPQATVELIETAAGAPPTKRQRTSSTADTR